MKFSVFIRKVFDRIEVDIWRKSRFSTDLLCLNINKSIRDHNIWLLGVPKSRNLGDQAQVFCTYRWCNKNYPEYQVFDFDSKQLLAHGGRLIHYIETVIKPDDIVLFQSGYNFTDMYPYEEVMHREVVRSIKNNRIIFMPQTISFKMPYENNEFVNESLELYRNNSNIYLLCRDLKSYSIAKEALPGVKKMPFPDVVTMLIGNRKFANVERKGIMLCVRNDEEQAYSDKQIQGLCTQLKSIDNVILSDTTVEYPSQFFIRRKREDYVNDMIEKMHSCKVVITDRYHGLIFSLISNTPVIVLKTIDHKITEGIKWFPEDMKKFVYLSDDISEIPLVTKKMLTLPKTEFSNYFVEMYYDRLKELLENDSIWDE